MSFQNAAACVRLDLAKHVAQVQVLVELYV